jgi:hypothetical protein
MLAVRLFEECLLRTHGTRWSVHLRCCMSDMRFLLCTVQADSPVIVNGVIERTLSEWEYISADESECRQFGLALL